MSDTSFFANLDDPKATPLHWAALRGNLGEVQALLAAEPGSVAVTDNHMWAPLHWAVAAGQAECAAALVRGGANLEVGGREAHTPWMANLDKFFYFDSPARHAEADKLAAAGFVRGAQALREGIAQTDPKALVGATPLHVAAGMGAVDCIRCLLKLGAPLEAANSLGLTAIHLAAACNHVQALQALLQAGADVRACDGYSNTPLHLAAGGGATACIKELLTASADMEASTEGGATPLHFAAAGGMLEALRVLIDAGAHVHATDEDGETPLHRAAAAGCVEAGTALLTAGTNLAAATTEPLGCRSPTLIAAGHGIIATVSALVAAGADINLRSGNGDTCLHVFLKRACMGYVPKAPKQLQQLLDLGASVELACEAWPTPVDAMLREIGNAKGCKLPSCVPKLVRLGFDIDWPPSLSDSAVDLGCALLDCLEAAGLCGTGRWSPWLPLDCAGALGPTVPSLQGSTPRGAAAARTLLLSNHRGLTAPPGLAFQLYDTDTGLPRGRELMHGGDAPAGTDTRVHLPPEVVLMILGEASHPPTAWVPQLQPGVSEASTSAASRFFAVVEGASTDSLGELKPWKVGLGIVAVAGRRARFNWVALGHEGGAEALAEAMHGTTPLHIAAGTGNVEHVRELLQQGVPPNAADSQGFTALHFAAACSKTAALRALVEGGADLNAPDAGNTALQFAAESDSLKSQRQLIGLGASTAGSGLDGDTPVPCAAAQGHAACVAELLAAGADKEAATATGDRPLHLAAYRGHAEVVRLLIEAGADIDAVQHLGMTPLFIVAGGGHVEALLALVNAGADLEKDGGTGPGAMSPIQFAAYLGHMNAVAALAAAGANINGQAGTWPSCLDLFFHRACKHHVPDAPERLRELLAAGASVQLACAIWPTPVDSFLHSIEHPTECRLPAYVPELIRVMAAAGCLITAKRTSEDGDLMISPLVLWLRKLTPGSIADWPVSLSSSSLDVAQVLLQCAAAEGGLPEGDIGDVMFRTLAIGSTPLVTAALSLLPERSLEVNDDIMIEAADLLRRALLALPNPGRVTMGDRARLACPGLAGIPGNANWMDLPRWARPHLREVVPLATSGLRWSPDAHKAFPPRLRAAARALLLANHRGLPEAAALGRASYSSIAFAGRTVEGTGARVHLPRVHLPRVHLPVLLILEKAAHPPASWVPVLQPEQLNVGNSIPSRMCRAADHVLRERPSARRVGLMLVAAVVGALVLGRGRRRRGIILFSTAPASGYGYITIAAVLANLRTTLLLSLRPSVESEEKRSPTLLYIAEEIGDSGDY
ncbi:hypothetical protein N2152v2_008686 [Parachlorella kessleri]